MKNKSEEILVVQVATAGLAAFMQVTGLCREEFTGLHDVNGIEELVFVDKPQLLITGIISDQSSDVAVLVSELRQKNPQLVVVTYSSCKIVGDCFDMQIEKMDKDSGRRVVRVLEEFRAGILRRKVTK
ncbi:MAG: hypothetical protein V4664_01660 [Patescibacteria group bacterium]